MTRKAFGGLTFVIDRPKGYVKTWPQPGGGEKSFTYPVDYGYLPRHKGEDDEGLDFFVGDEGPHLESFQKLRKNDDGKYVLDETKFLVGVTDAERETIYKLYGPEVWHRKVYRDMDELQRDLPKFETHAKDRYKTAFDFGAVRSRLSTIPDTLRRAFTRSQPTMLAPMRRTPAPAYRPAPPGYTHVPGAVYGGMLEDAAGTMLPGMTRQTVPHAIESWAMRHGGGSMIDAMARRAGELGYADAAKSRTLDEFRESFVRKGYRPAEIFAPTDPAGMGKFHPQWHTTSKVGASLAEHGVMGTVGALKGLYGGVRHPLRSSADNASLLLRPVKKLVEYGGLDPAARTAILAAHAGSMAGTAGLGYGTYRGGKALYDHFQPQAPEAEMTPKQAALARYGLDKIADIDKRLTGEILMSKVQGLSKKAHEKLALSPRALSALGAGIGMGVGAVHGFRSDDSTQSVEHHMMRAARDAAIGGAVGGLTGYGAGRLFKKVAPGAVEAVTNGPFPTAYHDMEQQKLRKSMLDTAARYEAVGHEIPDELLSRIHAIPQDSKAPLKAFGQTAYHAVMNPVSRFAGGAYLGTRAAQGYGDWLDNWRLQQYAAQKGQADNPNTPNAGDLEAMRARQHMGAYSSSLDRGRV